MQRKLSRYVKQIGMCDAVCLDRGLCSFLPCFSALFGFGISLMAMEYHQMLMDNEIDCLGCNSCHDPKHFQHFKTTTFYATWETASSCPHINSSLHTIRIKGSRKNNAVDFETGKLCQGAV